MLGRIVHMDYVREHLTTKKQINLEEQQDQPNLIQLDILADTVYAKVPNTIDAHAYRFSFTQS